MGASRIIAFYLFCAFLFTQLPSLQIALPMSLGPAPEEMGHLAKPAPMGYDRNLQKSPGTIAWIWDQYIGAPGQMQGDDVLHWGSTLGPYHNYSEVLAHIADRLSDFSEVIEVFTIGISYNGLSIPCIQITAPGDTLQRQGFLVVAQHHGREAITVENALYFLDYLLAHFDDPQVQRMLDKFVLYIIPSLNPDVLGMLHINPWQRKNLRPTDEDGDGLADEWEVQDVNGDFTIAFFEDPDEYYYTYEGIDLDGDGETGEDLPGGIDLNRNYPVAFSAGISDPRSEIYHGTNPFSEPETQAMLNFTMHHHQNLVFGVSLHSGTDVLLTPWSHTSEPSYHEPFFANLGAAVQAASGFEWWSATQLYPSYGTWDDWLYGEYGIPAVTLEVYGNESAWGHSIWDYFNPSADQVLANCEKVREAIFAMADVLLDEPGEPFIVVPGVVSSGISTLVSVYINQSLSGFDVLFLEYRFNPVYNRNWVGVPLIYQGGNRYDAFVPAPTMDGTMELHVYGRDFAGHAIYSDSVFYTISVTLFFGQIMAIIVLVIVVVFIVILFVRRRRRQRT